VKPQKPNMRGPYGTWPRHDVTDEVEYLLPVTIRRRGHAPPFPPGTLVRCTFEGPDLYDALEVAKQTTKVRMNLERVGLVVETAWHVDVADMHRVDVHTPSRGGLPRVAEPSLDLWYLLEFQEGRFWARYNWLEAVVEPGLR